MIRKIFKYCYFLFLLVLVLLILALGMANDGSVMLNLLAGKTDITVSALMGFSILAGALFFSLIWFYIVFSQWSAIRNLKRRIRRMERDGVPGLKKLPETESLSENSEDTGAVSFIAAG